MSISAYNRLGIRKRFDELFKGERWATMSRLELVQRCGCTWRIIERLFMLSFGVPFDEKRNEVRLQIILRELREKQNGIRQVMTKTRFSCQTTFNEFLKQQTGLGPREWRKKNLGWWYPTIKKRPWRHNRALVVAWRQNRKLLAALKEARKTIRELRAAQVVKSVWANGAHCRDIVSRMRTIQESIQRGDFPTATTLGVLLKKSTKTIHRDLDYLRHVLKAPIAWNHDRHGFQWLDPETSIAVPKLPQVVSKLSPNGRQPSR